MDEIELKRNAVLSAIKPICDAFGIMEYDYIIDDGGRNETLKIYDTKIGCTNNSAFAVKQELVGYIFLAMWRYRSLGAFETQVKNVIKQYWQGG